MRFRRLSAIAALLLFVPCAAARATAPAAADERPAPSPVLLFGERFPIEARASFPAALLHWLDTLTNLNALTSGKTREVHVRQYARRIGEPGEHELFLLRDWAVLRVDVYREHGAPDPLTLAFFEADDLEGAMERARAVVGVESYRKLHRVIEHFAHQYRRVWRDGQLPRLWLQRVEASDRLDELAGFLDDVARFYGVDPADAPPPVVLLCPVPPGGGTHAQAIGRFLLIEVRPSDGLDEQVAPLVHENAHYMFTLMDEGRREALAARAAASGRRGERSWTLLHEALPTAIAQGEADRRFRRGRWSREAPWYHLSDVDDYAKAIYPLVREALRSPEGRLDETFIGAAHEVSPRSP